MYTGKLQITLFVRDVPESVEYYQRVLGFSFSGYWSPAAQRFVDTGSMIESTDRAELLAGPNRILLRKAEAQSALRAAEYSLEVEDLDLVHRRAVASGGLTDRPSVVSNGDRRFTLTDGDGHVWHLYQS
jgi:uncharacterized glyoxalase superfamily protein PhnB